MNYLQLKAELLINGIDATPEALKDVGSAFKEQNHGLFGWDFEDHTNIALPDDFRLPNGTIVQFRRNSYSNFVVQLLDNKLILTDGKQELCTIQWLPRPKFYIKKTISNNEMIKIGQVGGEDCLFFCYQNYCSHFVRNEQCLFCNLVATSTTYNSVLRNKDTEDIGEVAKEAFSEKNVKHVLLTGGCFSHEKEIQLVSDIINSISQHTGFSSIPGTILPSPPKTVEEIERYHCSGINAIGFSIEIWDKRLFQAICPGKSKSISHEAFVESISKAVKIFGEGNVYGVFVMGLEPRETFLQGIRELTDLGANIVPFVWSPNPGSKFEGHRAPTSKWYIDTITEAAEIVKDARVPSGTENHCYRCDGNSLLHDALRLKGII
ncbi:MAG TPA: radical SAM protein [Candidatus Sulfotelmatobacter sp.]|nr:radical SAM protein [Candidatus Sulfotelmatobacter sp.]